MEPTNCDTCSNNFLSHSIECCPECSNYFCNSCMENHGFDDEDFEEDE